MKKSMLSVAVSSALVLVSQASFAEATQTVIKVTDDQVINQKTDGQNVVVAAPITISYEGTKAETLTFSNLDTTYDSYVKAQGSNAQIIFQRSEDAELQNEFQVQQHVQKQQPHHLFLGRLRRRAGHRDRQFPARPKSMDVDQIVHAAWNGKVVFKGHRHLTCTTKGP